ncbi:DNA polymerase [Candidatus Riflebacteria bacterium]
MQRNTKKISIPYEPYFPAESPDPAFNTRLKFVLIDTPKKYEEVFAGVTGRIIAFDSETTGLNYDQDKIVGCSISFDGESGYYLPFRHSTGKNLPISYLYWVYQLLLRNKILLFNAVFDMLMLQHDLDIKQFGDVDVWEIDFFEVQALVYNADTNIRPENRTLKKMALHYLGRTVPTFKETLGMKTVFSELKPEDGAFYAICDSANTFALSKKLYPILVEECPSILFLDNQLTRTMLHYNSCQVTIDREEMEGQKLLLEKEITRLEAGVQKALTAPTAATPINLKSPKQLREVFLGLGIDTGVLTNKGKMSTDEGALKNVTHPACKVLLEFRQSAKQLSSYIKKLCVNKGYFAFHQFGINTGRMSSGKSKKNSYYIDLSYQTLTKPKPAWYGATRSEDADAILGWKFTQVTGEYAQKHPGGYYVEGFSPDMNVRRAVTVPNTKDWLFVAMDYASQELRMAANLSNEPVWINAFQHGKDLHTETSIRVFGDASHRKEAKVVNFALLYGGGAYTIHQDLNLPLAECRKIEAKLWETIPAVKRWWKMNKMLAKENKGNVYSHIGRPRRILHYLSSSQWKLQKDAEKLLINSPIQGSCADILRIVLVNLYWQVFRRYPDQVQFIGTVHDEINFAIRKDFFHEIIPTIRDIMELKIPGMQVPFTTDIEVGYSYGMLWPFIQDTDGTWKPKRAIL